MTTKYYRCVMPADSEYLNAEGKVEVGLSYTDEEEQVQSPVPETTFTITPQGVVQISDAASQDGIEGMCIGISTTRMFAIVEPDPDPPAVDVDFDEMLEEFLGS